MRWVSADQPSASVPSRSATQLPMCATSCAFSRNARCCSIASAVAHRFADVAEAGEAADDFRVDAVRCGVALVDPPVLETQDIDHFGRWIAPNRARAEEHRLEIDELRTRRFDEAVDAAALHIVGGQAEHLQVLLVVEDDAPVEIDDHDAVVRGFKRGFEQGNRFFERRTIGQRSPSISMTLSSPGIDQPQVVCTDVRSRFGGGARTGKERRRWLPEHRAADREADGRSTFIRGGEPALDRRDVGGFAENDLPALRLRRDRAIDRARAVGRGCAFDLPELRGQPAAVRLRR